MPFPFIETCTLLNNLERLETCDAPLLGPAKYSKSKELIESWFKSHRRKIIELSEDGQTALLSTLLPEWRTDRVYGIQTQSLYRMLSRTLGLGTARLKDLEAYKQPGFGDLPACLERVLRAGGTPAHPPVQLEEVDDMLGTLASGSIFSDPSIPRLPRSSSEMRDPVIARLLKRVRPDEGKWLARLILKDFSPVRLDEFFILKNFHFLLPDLLRFQRSFRSAVGLLKGELSEYHAQPDPRSQRLFRLQASQRMRPTVNTKVGRPTFHKARGIEHCLNMLGSQEWVIERKYDGEYCEVHVELLHAPDWKKCIKIYAKSGKDATADRAGLHETLISSLRLGDAKCRFKRRAIFLGELVVYSDEEDRVMPFDEIRKHVTRSGVRLGADADSQPRACEHLAIVFFDILLLDDEIVMNRPVEERRQWLRETYRKIHGRALGAEWKKIDFTDREYGRRKLIEQFGHAIGRRCEGLVLKPCGVPYFSLDASPDDFKHSFIKLKKDYIDGMGDEADFAVIGASYVAQKAAATTSTASRYTSFHLGCLTNKDDVRRVNARPIYKYVWTVDHEKCIPKPVLEAANIVARFAGKPYTPGVAPQKFNIDSHITLKMDVVFDEPFVVEVLGSGFDKPSNCRFLMLRHARVKKLHEDRTWMECVTFQELQQQGDAARSAPADSELQDTLRWIAKLEASSKRTFERERSMSMTPRYTRSRTSLTPLRASISAASVSGRVKSPGHQHPGVDGLPTPLPSSAAQPTTTSPNQTRCRKRALEGPQTHTVAKRVRADHSTTSAEASRLTPPVSSPLNDITNTANGSPTREPARHAPRSSALTNIVNKVVTLVQPTRPTTTQLSKTHLCENSTCAFSNTTIYLAPCIASTLYITEDLLSTHAVAMTPTLSHWDRNSFSHDPLTDTVSESQSHPGMRKIVLVEHKRRTATRALVQIVLQLNDGRFKERVEVWDWRMLEECQGHDRPVDRVKKYFLGATIWDEGRRRAMFVSGCEWLRF
ncbi:DNA ligase 4 [Fulvia fulva]|uniref:DNA ligase 4 n=1 Tax=Passalora fulva TaxID=5499 RepID=A0A9Q8PA60_PASFU|nr:DNA ligase 4 [Fulvia fulva]KAK4622152.1 DNA ligase 4 [Fulvia fulva]KAK4622793.1 DNA ligase 4 [Fulvia fulva]UJO18711.1 DNA ligase 4 [Fulvia fulva]WPV16127.1 DNA ligase 4 [Fulvia fulva]WPV30837.1 DNA ligase 4 [Fulvia fulva]